MTWAVVCEPVDDTTPKGKNRAALRVCLTDGTETLECARVGLIRRNTENPGVEFAAKLQEMLDKAQECATTINELHEYLEELRVEAAKHAAVRVKDIMGERSPVPV